MRKHIILSLMAAAAFAACSTDEVCETSPPPAPKAIAFADGWANKATRADALTGASITKFAVWGWQTTKASPAVTKQIFTAQFVNKATKPDGTVAWTYQPLRYWAPGCWYKFFAISASQPNNNYVSYTAKAGGVTSWNDITDVNYEITQTNSFTDDIVYAVGEAETSDPMTGQPGDVQLTFNHVLSQMVVTLQDISEDGYRVELVGAPQYSGCSKAKFSLLPNQDDKTAPQVTWSVAGTNDKLNINLQPSQASTDGSLWTSAAEYGTNNQIVTPPNPIYVIPQQNTNGNITFTARLYAIRTGQTGDSEEELINEKELTGIIQHTFLPGRSYHVIISVGHQNFLSEYPIMFEVVGVSEFTPTPPQTVTLDLN